MSTTMDLFGALITLVIAVLIGLAVILGYLFCVAVAIVVVMLCIHGILLFGLGFDLIGYISLLFGVV